MAIEGIISSMMFLVSFRTGNLSARYLADISARRLASILARRLIDILTKYLVIFKYNKIKNYLFLLYFIK
jgi:hypothetical protein